MFAKCHIMVIQQLSQFWYDDRTSQILAEEALKASNSERYVYVILGWVNSQGENTLHCALWS